MINPSSSVRVLLAAFLLASSSWFVKAKHSNKSCEFYFDCTMSGYEKCCVGGRNRYCSNWQYCNAYCELPTHCASSEFCVDGYCSKKAGTGTISCYNDQDCDDVNLYLGYNKFVECYDMECLPSTCKYCRGTCKNEQCEDKNSEEDSHSFSPASIIGFTAVVLIGSCIACTLYCGCGRRRQQPLPRPPVDNEIENEQPEDGIPPPSSPLHPDAPPPYHSLEMIDRIQVEPLPPSYAEALRNSHNNIDNV